MRLPNARSITVSWILAAALPIPAGVLGWVWTGITTTARECATGSRSGDAFDLVALAIPVLLPAVAIGWQSRRMAGPAARAVSPIVISILPSRLE